MKFDEFMLIINQSVKERFRIQNLDNFSLTLKNLCPDNLLEKALLRIQRSSFPENENKYWKTLIIVRINEQEHLRSALEWVALVKDMLLNPENSDLYLFLCWGMEYEQSLEDCLRIESSEEFCRKYVVHPRDTGQSFIERTFISKIDDSIQKQLGTDPLLSAFSVVANTYPWFNEIEKKKWKEVFVSGKTGAELIESLFFTSDDSI